MARPGVASPATHTRGRACRRCGADEWEKGSEGYDRCRACQRGWDRKGKQRQRAEDPARALFWLAQQRAKKKGLSFTITVDDVKAVWPADGKCPVLGIELIRGTNGKTRDSSPTLDRLNNAWGYDAGNIAVISKRANSAKSSLTAAELEEVAAWMRRSGLS